MLLHSGDCFRITSTKLDLPLGNSSKDVSSHRPLGSVERGKQSSKRVRKKVTFKKDLVSIREIPARTNRSDSSDNGASSDSSTDDDSDTSVTDCSSEEDEDSEGSIADSIHRLVLRHTGVKPLSRKLAKNSALRSIPPRPPRLRRPRVATVSHRKAERLNTSRNQNKALSNSQNFLNISKSKPPVTFPTGAHGLGRLTQLRRAQSSSADQRDRVKHRPPSPTVLRSSSAKASLTLTSRSSAAVDDAGSTVYGLSFSNTNRQTFADSNNTNSGQERTKFYAWQVANGAPLVTTPGIAPLCAEQVTITKLKD